MGNNWGLTIRVNDDDVEIEILKALKEKKNCSMAIVLLMVA